MDKQLKDMADFMTKFDQPVADEPKMVDAQRQLLRFNMLHEENMEYLQACTANDLVEVADALTDQLYLVLGNFCTHGLQDIAVDLFNEVHRSNMSKLGDDGKPVYYEGTIKVGKGPNYSPPDLRSIIEAHFKNNN